MALTLDDVRRIALALPEVAESPHFERASLRVAGKIFCTFGVASDEMVIKLNPEDQQNLVADNASALSPVVGAWGRKGWTKVRIPELAPARLEMLVRLAWATVAPKRLLRPARLA
jgi:hypothetical protein